MNTKQLSCAVSAINDEYLNEYNNEVAKLKSKSGEYKIIAVAFAGCAAVIIGAVLVYYQTKTPAVYVEETQSVTDITVPKQTDDSKNSTTDKKKSNGKGKNSSLATYSSQSPKSKSSKGGIGIGSGSLSSKHVLGPDKVSHYEIFWPETDKFEPVEEMPLEKRFGEFTFNEYTYTAAQDGEITTSDYEPYILIHTKTSYYENRTDMEQGIAGIMYNAAIEIHKLNGYETNEAVACVIIFNGERKEYKFNVSKQN